MSNKSSDAEKGKTATTTPPATVYRSFKALIHKFSRQWVDGIVFTRIRLEASGDTNKPDREVASRLRDAFQATFAYLTFLFSLVTLGAVVLDLHIRMLLVLPLAWACYTSFQRFCSEPERKSATSLNRHDKEVKP